MKRTKGWVFPLAALIVLALFGHRVAFAGNMLDRTITEGSAHEGNIEVFGDDFDLDEGATVTGDVSIFGGDAKIAGTVDGTLFVAGGDVEITESAEINGDCVVLFGGKVENSASFECVSMVEGEFGEFIQDGIRENFDGIDSIDGSSAEYHTHSGTDGGDVIGAIFGAIFTGILALIVTSLAPRRIERMADAVTFKPVVVGTVGILSFFAAIAGIVIVAVLSALLTIVLIGLLGIPVIIVMVFAMVAALIVGWVAVGKVIGDTLADALRMHNLSPAKTAALGAAAMSLVINVLGLMPIIGFSAGIAGFIIMSIGVGSVALTRFGTFPYPRIVLHPSYDAPSVEDQIVFDSEKLDL